MNEKKLYEIVDKIVDEFEYIHVADVIDDKIIIDKNEFNYEIIEFIENEYDIDVEFKYVIDEIDDIVVELFIEIDDDIDDPIIQQFKNEIDNIDLKNLSYFLDKFYLNHELNVNQIDEIIKIVENKIDKLIYINSYEINEFIKDIIINIIL